MSGDPLTEVLRYLAANVRHFRLKAGLTQEQLAEMASIDLTFLQRIERAKSNVSLETLAKLSKPLGVSVARLLKFAVMQPIKPGRPRK